MYLLEVALDKCPNCKNVNVEGKQKGYNGVFGSFVHILQ